MVSTARPLYDGPQNLSPVRRQALAPGGWREPARLSRTRTARWTRSSPGPIPAGGLVVRALVASLSTLSAPLLMMILVPVLFIAACAALRLMESQRYTNTGKGRYPPRQGSIDGTRH